jgi:hypothetical protein
VGSDTTQYRKRMIAYLPPGKCWALEAAGSGSKQHAKNRKKILAIGLTTRDCLRERACDKNRDRFCLTTFTVANTTQRQCWISPY